MTYICIYIQSDFWTKTCSLFGISKELMVWNNSKGWNVKLCKVYVLVSHAVGKGARICIQLEYTIVFSK